MTAPSRDITWICRCGQANTQWGPCSACLNPPPDDIVLPARPHRWPRRVVVALVLVVALLLAGGAGGVVLLRADSEPAATKPPPRPAAAADIRTVVAELSRFVESARGLAFEHEVEVVLLTNDDFTDRVLEGAELDAGEIEETAKVLRTLGLLEADVDLQGRLEDLLGAAIAGFYDPETGELVVRGAEPSPAVRITLVHELTHALQDQHFELHRPDLDDADDETAQAFGGLVEGDAERIAEQYRDTLGAADLKAAEREQVAQSAALSLGAEIPRILIELLAFPYIVGPSFVEALVADAPTRLDEAFAAPPTTSEHLFHPDRYLAGEPVVRVEPPEAEGEVIDEGALGELGLRLMLREVSGLRAAVQAADGWGGDWYVAWDEGDRTCVRATVVMDAPAHARELRAALGEWAADHGDATVSGSDAVSFTACA